uniref:Uncharacterized protein n=1 Tax=Arundo donax TaxID=35708 RepID=A0A0A9EZU6_ARUDO
MKHPWIFNSNREYVGSFWTNSLQLGSS